MCLGIHSLGVLYVVYLWNLCMGCVYMKIEHVHKLQVSNTFCNPWASQTILIRLQRLARERESKRKTIRSPKMRINKLIHLYEMAGDKSPSSFLMWTMSCFTINTKIAHKKRFTKFECRQKSSTSFYFLFLFHSASPCFFLH